MKRNSGNTKLIIRSGLLCGLGLAFGLALPSCATTTIQTGGNQYSPRDFREREPEERFFNEMSRQDEAFQQKSEPEKTATEQKSDEIELTSRNCPCDAKRSDEVAEQRAARLDQYVERDNENKVDYQREAIPATRTTEDPPVENTQDGQDYRLTGTASWYGRDFDGKPTASGVPFDSRKLTAAHKKIPLGSIVLVRNLENGKEILVTINDRGPYVGDRILDVSEYGAELLGYKEQGLTQVELKIVRLGKGKGRPQGATYNFFSSRDESGNMGAGDDPGANREIDRLLSKEAVAPRKSQSPRRSSVGSAQVLPESVQNGYAVQVGIFDDLRNARHLKTYLEKGSAQGTSVRIYRRGNRYAVKLGEFSDRKEADYWKGRMIAEGYHAFVSESGN